MTTIINLHEQYPGCLFVDSLGQRWDFSGILSSLSLALQERAITVEQEADGGLLLSVDGDDSFGTLYPDRSP